ncbi:hypothetical protein SRHO_G00156900 [Serrasalmus rhombeus]
MELCEQYGFDPECTVILKGDMAKVSLETVQEVFDLLDHVVKIQHIDVQLSTILCQFRECITPVLLEAEYTDGSGSHWEVIQLEEYSPDKIETSPKSEKLAPLARVIDDMTINFRERIEELANTYNVSPINLSQKAMGYMSGGKQHKISPLTSTPAPHHKQDFLSDANEGVASNVKFPSVSQVPNADPSLVIPIPADAHRVLVEHIVKHDSHTYAATPQELPAFSGNFPKPHTEADFSTWQLRAKQRLKDPTLNENQKRSSILNSLLSPALNVALRIGLQAAPSVYLQELDNAYGNVTGGEELYIQFLETHQNNGERVSEYLRRLQTLLQEVIERNGVSRGDADSQLLKQFLRGCWDDHLIDTLHLKDLITDPSKSIPTFSEMLLKIRTYEKESHLKEMRRKRHLGVPSTKVHAKTHMTPDDPKYSSSDSSALDACTRTQLEERIRQLEAEIKRNASAPKFQHKVTPMLGDFVTTVGRIPIYYLSVPIQLMLF